MTQASVNSANDSNSFVDVVIPAFNEKAEALEATLRACQEQTKAPDCIFVVDDGSHPPMTLPPIPKNSKSQVQLIRLAENQGISAARNRAISEAAATFRAGVNTEVLPQNDWIETCLEYLIANPNVGACYTRTDPIMPESLLTRWRLRFQDARYPEQTSPSPFAHGHAVFFRRTAIDQIGGYDVRFRVSHEDWDISQRLWANGWEVHFINRSKCVSIQDDTLRALAIKQLRDTGWSSARESSLLAFVVGISRWTLVRAARNVAKFRFYFLPVDAALWAYSIWLATSQKLRHSFGRA